MTAAATNMSQKAWDLHAAVVRRSSDIRERLQLLTQLAADLTASPDDVIAVRDHILRRHIRECSG